ncbi:unnamed protein product [Mytilus coruscus]|uniref:Uncharacterized protein n=1 Tax=Mytilus coruscus TaxID=42192 RepID=A0A6J8BPR6_MYTCO|nr:unnamed protein product [Mytilus coruscus]
MSLIDDAEVQQSLDDTPSEVREVVVEVIDEDSNSKLSAFQDNTNQEMEGSEEKDEEKPRHVLPFPPSSYCSSKEAIIIRRCELPDGTMYFLTSHWVPEIPVYRSPSSRFTEDSADFCFKSDIFKNVFRHKIVFDGVMRQDEPDFVKAIHDISRGDLPTDTHVNENVGDPVEIVAAEDKTPVNLNDCPISLGDIRSCKPGMLVTDEQILISERINFLPEKHKLQLNLFLTTIFENISNRYGQVFGSNSTEEKTDSKSGQTISANSMNFHIQMNIFLSLKIVAIGRQNLMTSQFLVEFWTLFHI